MDDNARLRPVLVNRYEKITDELLAAAATEHGDRLLAKVRLADVIDVSPWTGSVKHYGLSAHFDFVMVDTSTLQPKFAVELDGGQHWTDPDTRRRDKMKDQLSDWAGLPLLRITSDFLRKDRRWNILRYVVEAYYLSEAFFEAQAAGHIPLDEPFIVTSCLMPRPGGGFNFNALDHESLLTLLRAFEAGRLPVYTPDQYHTIDRDAGAVQTDAWMAVAPARYLVARARVRDFRFQGISASELASQLAVVEITNLAEQWLAGGAAACDQRALLQRMAAAQSTIDVGGFLGSVTGSALKAGGPLPRNIVTKFHRGT